MAAGATPTYIFPVVPGADSSVYTSDFFQDLMWKPLWWTPSGHSLDVDYGLSLASKPTFSNDNKTVVINMKTNYKWSNGQPVDANDVIFFIDLVKAAVKISAANYGNYSPGYFPDNVTSAKATGKFQVTIQFTKSYNPGYLFYDQLLLLTPLPSTAWDIDAPGGKPVSYSTLAGAEKIYKFLSAQATKLSTYATNPLWQDVDGPFKLTAFNPSTDANTMVPNPAYSGQKASIAKFQEVAFTSDAAEYTALRSGQLTVGLVPSDDYPQVPTLKKSGFNVFGFPDLGWDYLLFNFKDKTGNWDKVIGQLYVRQALAHLVDDQGYISGIFHGYAASADGPVPSVPQSPFTPANAKTDPYPFSISDAISLLKSHGWTVTPNGTDVCKSAGTGATQCGAGIPAGTKLAFPLVSNTSPAIIGEQTTDLASEAAKAGIKINLSSDNFNHMIETYNDPASPKTINKWAVEDFGGFSNSTYPTTLGVFNSTGSSNLGGYDSPQADKLINASITSSNPAAVTAEASYLTTQQPGLFQPNPDLVQVWKKTLSGAPSSFESLTQYQLNPEYWYFTK